MGARRRHSVVWRPSVSAGGYVSESRTWFDPLVVARLTAPLDNAWRLGLKGDVGGFGMGSDITWSAFASVGYRFGDLFELTGGYRMLGMEYEDGSGEDLFAYDMTIYGPQIGVAFHF